MKSVTNSFDLEELHELVEISEASVLSHRKLRYILLITHIGYFTFELTLLIMVYVINGSTSNAAFIQYSLIFIITLLVILILIFWRKAVKRIEHSIILEQGIISQAMSILTDGITFAKSTDELKVSPIRILIIEMRIRRMSGNIRLTQNDHLTNNKI